MKVPSLLSRPRLALFLTAAVLASSPTARADTAARLAGHVPRAAVARARALGRVASGDTIRLALTLPLRDPQGLETLLHRQSTPGDPLFHQWLTPAEFADRFGATEGDYARVAESARRSGLVVVGTHPNRLLLDVSGTAAQVEAAFGTRLVRYQARDGRVFRAPQSDPALPDGMRGRVAGVVGLDTASLRRAHLRERSEEDAGPAGRKAALAPQAGSGPKGGVSPADFATAYGLAGSAATGAGQTLALFELDGYNPADVAAYESAFGLPSVPLTNVLVDGAKGTPGADADECTLDIELALAGAPGLSKILVYEAPNDNQDSTVLDLYSRIANDNAAQQVGTSWGYPENLSDSPLLQSENTIFMQMAAQGQSVFAASGDNGAYDDGSTLSVDDPASQPYVTGVGGTSLNLSAGGGYVGEMAWSDRSDTTYSSRGSGTGGGVSAVWPAPTYQSGLLSGAGGRSVPDVALDADPNTGFSIYVGGGWHVYGGTSAAVPLWTGFAARVNGARASQGAEPIGFFNPPVYALGAGPSYGADFHDVTSGDNLHDPATVGYDKATGFGSFQGGALLNALVGGLPAPQTGVVSGTVTAADTGAPLAGATVAFNSTAGGVALLSGLTDGSGNYSGAVPAGVPFSVTVNAYAASGGRYAGAQAFPGPVAAGQSVTQSFALGPAHTYPAGLQMLSSPFDYSALTGFPANGGDFAALFGTAGQAHGAQFLQWEPGLADYVFYPFAPVATMRPGQGYWASLPSPAYLHYDGAPVPAGYRITVPLPFGWNQVGDPYPFPVPVSSLTDGGGTPITSSSYFQPTLYRYDTASGAYVALTPGVDSLQPYVGYWIYARGITSLAFPTP